MSIQEVIQGIRDVIVNQTGKTSPESKWSDPLLYFHLNNYRIRVLYEKRINPGIPISDFQLHTIPCMKLEPVLAHECPCVAEGIEVLRTVHPIPEPITGELHFIGTLGQQSYTWTRFEDFNKLHLSRFARIRKRPRYSLKTIDNATRAYIINEIHVEDISIKLLPIDIRDIARLPDCNGKVLTCIDPYKLEFVIDDELMPLVYQWFAKDILNISMATGIDVVQDNLDLTRTGGKG